MTLVVCDICRRELEPRSDAAYGWFSKGGVVVVVDGSPARLEYEGRTVNECCYQCLAKCYARTQSRVGKSP